jgi:hypothetical protein
VYFLRTTELVYEWIDAIELFPAVIDSGIGSPFVDVLFDGC